MTYLTINQVAQRLGVHRRTVRRWISTGRLRAARFGPHLIRIEPAALEEFGRPIPTVKRRD